jgi:endonuclease YncB( thermonuclease family)
MGNKQLKYYSNEVPEFSFNNINTYCKVVDVYDGDTFRIVFIYKKRPIKITIRAYGCDTPELFPPKAKSNREEEMKIAKMARNRLVQLCTDCTINVNQNYSTKEIKEILKENRRIVYIRLGKYDKYGRILGRLYQNKKDTMCIHDILINENLGIKYMTD